MLNIFPPIYDDEVIYSIFYRYKTICGSNKSYTLENLFGTGTVSINTMFPKRLNYLINRLPITLDYNIKWLLFKNTILSAYKPFLTSEMMNSIINAIIDGDEKYYNGNLGLTTKPSLLKIESLKFCSDCIEQDIDKYGELYLHREHQIKGNNTCFKHKKILYEYVLQQDEIISFNNIKDKIKKIDIGQTYNEHLMLARDIHDVLTSNHDDIDLKTTYKKYLSMLYEKGYSTEKGYFKQKNINNDFKGFYSEGFLNAQNANFNINYKDNWLNRISMRSKHICNPIKNLLFVRFLFGSYKNFIEYKPIYADMIQENKTQFNNSEGKNNRNKIKDALYWIKKDEEISKKINLLMKRILNDKDSINKRIGITYVGNNIQYPFLFEYIDKMPKSKFLLDNYMEMLKKGDNSDSKM